VESPSVIVRAEPLTPEAFAPFGEVVEHRGPARRSLFTGPFEIEGAEARPAMWVTRVEEGRDLPIVLGAMERHPLSAQTFIPLRGQAYLVAVCPARADGAPDASEMRAFVGGPHQGVVYRRNVWHHGLTVLAQPAEFVVLMASVGGAGRDDVFLPLEIPVTVLPPAGLDAGPL